MTTVNITVKGAQASAVVCGVLTTGSVGAKAVFSFDEGWKNLAKSAVFRANGSSRTVLLKDDEAIIPWEVLQIPNVTFSIGVYGTDGESLAIPTVWADCGVIKPGTTGEMMPQSTIPLWAQMHARLEAVEEVANQAETDPTVPGWAKEESPPSAKSIGAIPVPDTARVGQTVVVKEVDESGKPTQWETSGLSGGYPFAGDWGCPIAEVTLEEEVQQISIPLGGYYKELMVEFVPAVSSTATNRFMHGAAWIGHPFGGSTVTSGNNQWSTAHTNGSVFRSFWYACCRPVTSPIPSGEPYWNTAVFYNTPTSAPTYCSGYYSAHLQNGVGFRVPDGHYFGVGTQIVVWGRK